MSDDLFRPTGYPSDGQQPEGSMLIDTIEVDRPAPTKAPKRKTNAWLEWFVVIFVAIGAALMVRAYVLQHPA